MRIECDKCAAKYSIADEKVRGKTFKIRCKKCSNVIIVRDKAAAGAEAAASEPAPADEPPGWHLAIDGDTVGPISEDEVRQRYDAGEVDKSTSVWQEGFEDWIELGQIEAFAGFPDREEGGGGVAGAAAAGAAVGAADAGGDDDPFASSGSDDAFAASSGKFGGGFGAEEPAAAAPAAAAPADGLAEDPEDPRVSSLTGQRNENSVLFSLDSLKAMASTQKPSSAGPVRSAPSTTAPASEGSGLIDIRAMGAMMDVGAGDGGGLGGGGGGEEDALPTFGGGGLGGLSVEPLVSEAPAAAAAPEPQQQRSNAPMYILIAILLLGLVGLGAMLLLKDDSPTVIEKTVIAPGSVEEKEKEKDDEKDEDEGKDGESTDDEGTDGESAETGGTETGGDGAVTKKKSTKKKSTKSVASGTTGGGSGGDTKPPPDTKKDPDVDCLLNPKLAKCGGGGGGGGSKASEPDPSLPTKLGTAQIKKGIDSVKAQAKTCGPKNGAAAGTKVGIKFSVKGSTGSVVSATPVGDYAGKPLGTCVAAAAKKAKFPKFQADQQGFQFNFRM